MSTYLQMLSPTGVRNVKLLTPELIATVAEMRTLCTSCGGARILYNNLAAKMLETIRTDATAFEEVQYMEGTYVQVHLDGEGNVV